MARLGVRSFGVYTLVGIGIWLGFHQSGVHATIAGVVLGLLTPSNPYLSEGTFSRLAARAQAAMTGGEFQTMPHRGASVRSLRSATRELVSPLEYLEGALHPWVGFAIMPVFALANAGVEVRLSAFGDPVAIAIAAGLLVGKPSGILLACWLAVRVGIAKLPDGVGWGGVAGGGLLAGIGFTMALFIAGLALDGPMLDAAKVGILAASTLAALFGMAVLLWSLPRAANDGS
jgi:NhaA family Na+:H+ antiporter